MRFLPAASAQDGRELLNRRRCTAYSIPLCTGPLVIGLLLASLCGLRPVFGQTLRSADVEVLVTRALDHLLNGRYTEARAETAPILDLDVTQRARYFHGVACSRLGDWGCAVEMFLEVQARVPAGQFPQLALELGVALSHEGRYAEARKWLELARGRPDGGTVAEQGASGTAGARPLPRSRHWNVFAAVGAGLDTNVPGMPGSGLVDCPPWNGGSHELPTSCGVFMLERLGGMMRFTPLGQRLQLHYQFQHRWYPGSSLSLFDTQDHRVNVTATLPARLELRYRFLLSALNRRYAPPYTRLQQLALGYRIPELAGFSTSIAYRFAWDVFGDLEEIWASDSGADMPCSTASSSGAVEDTLSPYCTSGHSGTRHRGEAKIRWQRPGLRLGDELGIEYARTTDPLLTGIDLYTRLWVELELGRVVINPALVLSSQRYPAWSVRQILPSVTIGVASIARVGVRIRYGFSGLSVISQDGSAYDNHYLRQLVQGEASYEF